MTAERILLRADLTLGDKTIATHTLEVGPERLRVVCPFRLAKGEEVTLAVSFPGIVDRVDLRCRIDALHAPDGYGHPASVTCAVVGGSNEERARLLAIGARAREATRELRCLLVEDNQFVRELFTYGVHKYGGVRERSILMSAAEDAEEAWRLLQNERYDTAIIDYYLPTQTGADLIARIRGNPDTAHLAVVAMSVGDADVCDAMIGAGADLFLRKPIVMGDLFDTLDKLAVEAKR